MNPIFKIEDAQHAEPLAGEYPTFESALEELKRLAAIPWNMPPNRCPCTGWGSCQRDYEVTEYDVRSTPWNERSRVRVLTVSAEGVVWKGE